VIDLMRVYLVFGLPLPSRKSAGEDDSDEPVPQTSRSDDLAYAVGTGVGDGLCPSVRTPK